METETKGELKSKLNYIYNRIERLHYALKEGRTEDAKEVCDDLATTIGMGQTMMLTESYFKMAKTKHDAYLKEMGWDKKTSGAD